MDIPEYIAVTACRNEEETIGRCLDSVLGQSYPPSCYVVVDDGSTDGTLKILKSFEPRIYLVSLKKIHRFQRGVHLLKLFVLGAKKAIKQIEDWEFLLSVDADEFLCRDYVEKLVKKMKENPRLGITSGIPYTKMNRGYIKREKASFNVWNGARLYRRKCFNQLQKIPGIQGWDMWVQFEANRLGWVTKPFDDVYFFEERLWGNTSSLSFSFWVRRGFVRYNLGFSMLSQILSSGKMVTQKPYILGSITFLFAYLLYRLFHENPFSLDYQRFVKRLTTHMVRGAINKRIMKHRE